MPFPVDDRFIAAEEELLGIRFPESFRRFLLRANGGDVDVLGDSWQVAPVFDSSDRKRMARTASHIARETKFARTWRNFPPAAVAIASNGSGDRLVLLPSSQQAEFLSGAVYIWDHETGELGKVAEDFDALVESAV